MKHMISKSALEYLREWQKNFIVTKYCPKHNNGNEHNLWFANCCTGSGKANLGFESAIQDMFFAESLGKKSVHVFVAPTIMLSNQIVREAQGYLSNHYFYDLNPNVEFKLMNCESDDKVDFSTGVYFTNGKKHLVEVYCADSFFGNDSNPNKYAQVYNHLEKMKKDGIMVGCAVFDESHNYSNQWELITGFRADSQEVIVKSEEEKVLTKLFTDVVCMSGTPCLAQCWMSSDERWNKDFLVSVNYAMAIKNNWIICPDFYVIKTFSPDQVIDPTIAVIEMEKALNKIEGKANKQTHLLVNCPSIDVAYDAGRKIWEYYGCDKEKVGITILHSTTKRVVKNKIEDRNPFIDGAEVKPSEAKDIIQKIDETDVGKTRIVFQVGMLSEGINVNSFDAVIITTHSDVKLIQQIGRSVRKFHGKNHTSVYAICTNENDVANIADQMFKQGLNIEEVLKGIKLIDISDSGLIEKDPEGVAKFLESNWKSYTSVEIEKLIELVENNDHQGKIAAAIKNSDANLDYLYNFIKKFGGFGIAKSASSGSSIGSKSSSKSSEKKSEKKGQSEKKSKKLSARAMVGEMKRLIKSRFLNMPCWNDCIIDNLDKDDMVHYSLANICEQSMSNIEKPNMFISDLIRHLIILSNNEVKGLEAESYA